MKASTHPLALFVALGLKPIVADAADENLSPRMRNIDERDARTVFGEKAAEARSTGSPYSASVSSLQRARLFAHRWPLIASSS